MTDQATAAQKQQLAQAVAALPSSSLRCQSPNAPIRRPSSLMRKVPYMPPETSPRSAADVLLRRGSTTAPGGHYRDKSHPDRSEQGERQPFGSVQGSMSTGRTAPAVYVADQVRNAEQHLRDAQDRKLPLVSGPNVPAVQVPGRRQIVTDEVRCVGRTTLTPRKESTNYLPNITNR